jgi:predicted nucleotidyltransferase
LANLALDIYIRAFGVNRVSRGYGLEKLPENAHNVLEQLLEDLQSRESVLGVGLFGSWSRGDASLSSDIDLLIVDGRDYEYEYVERAELENIFIDLDYVPSKWVLRQIPPEIDQKLFESQVLFDRNGRFVVAKNLMSKNYWTLERVEMRIGDYVMQADTYLSRIVSALNRNDFQSAKVSAVFSLAAVMRVLLEVARKPYSNSRFLRMLESTTIRLGKSELYEEYLDLAGLNGLNRQSAEGVLGSVSDMWQQVIDFVEANSPKIENIHIRVKNDLNYYCKENFLKGMQTRANTLINDSLYEEAAHYLFRASISMLENYVWLLSALEGTRFDYTYLFQRLKNSSLSPPSVYERVVDAFDLKDVSQSEAEKAQKKAKEIVLGIRQKRKEFAATFDV